MMNFLLTTRVVRTQSVREYWKSHLKNGAPLKTMSNALNAGVDLNSYEPVTFDELVENNRKFIVIQSEQKLMSELEKGKISGNKQGWIPIDDIVETNL